MNRELQLAEIVRDLVDAMAFQARTLEALMSEMDRHLPEERRLSAVTAQLAELRMRCHKLLPD